MVVKQEDENQVVVVLFPTNVSMWIHKLRLFNPTRLKI
jgi:hypothetical protein